MTRSPDEWPRVLPARRLSYRLSITPWTALWDSSEQLARVLREAAVKRTAQLWMELRAWFRRHQARFGLFFRVTASALISFELARWLDLHVALWAVLTAIIVTQMSVGQSLKAAIDYLAGTIGGAIYGAIVGILVGHDSVWPSSTSACCLRWSSPWARWSTSWRRCSSSPWPRWPSSSRRRWWHCDAQLFRAARAAR